MYIETEIDSLEGVGSHDYGSQQVLGPAERVSKQETQETQKSSRLRTQEEPVFEVESEGRKKSVFHFKGRRNSLLPVGGSDLLFY